MYMMTYSRVNASTSGCNGNGPIYALTIIDPTGNVIYTCVQHEELSNDPVTFVTINMEINNILSQGYKLVYINTGANTTGAMISNENEHNVGTSWYFAIPWTSSGIAEVSTTLNSLSISPNPATYFVNINLSYDLKGESEIVFISEAGYIYHKESIGSISKKETYNIDISRIPAGKYLVTIKNKKKYTTPQKLIIL